MGKRKEALFQIHDHLFIRHEKMVCFECGKETEMCELSICPDCDMPLCHNCESCKCISGE